MSAALTTQQLTELLHTAADLETAIYTLDQAIPKTKKQIEQNTPKEPRVRRKDPGKKPARPATPKAPADAPPEPPVRPERPASKMMTPAEKKVSKYLAIFYLLCGLIIVFYTFSLGLIGYGILCFLFLFAGPAAVIYFGVPYYRRRKAEKETEDAYRPMLEKYQREYEAYQKALAEYQQKHQRELERYQQNTDSYPQRLEQYQQDLAVWEEASEKAEAAYQKELSEAQESHSLAMANYKAKSDQLIVPMEKLLKDSQKNLEALYDADWLYPKYRTLPAVTTICEYFLSGRCSELTGPDGAYNLYEAELRQDRIIGKLEDIAGKLDQIQKNQYLLYTELQKANQTALDISQNVSSILKSTLKIERHTRRTADHAGQIAQDTKAIRSHTEDIAWNTKCTAYFSEITAKNAEAIKILTFLNGVK